MNGVLIHRIIVQLIDLRRVSDSELVELADRYGGPKPNPVSQARARERVGARAALALIADPKKWRIERNSEYGYSWLEDLEGKRASVSFTHSGTMVAAGFLDSQSPLGVDLEFLSRNPGRALERVSSAQEMNLASGTTSIGGVAVPNSLLLWTGKEAASKASGLGMRYGLDNFTISTEFPFRVELKRLGPLALKSPRLWFQVVDGVLVAVCASEDSMAGDKPVDLLTYPLS